MRDGRKSLVLLAAPLALLSLSACGGDAEGPLAEGEYDPDAPSLEEVSSDAELANEIDSTEEPVTNLEVAE
ncbi:hypothetical protein [Sphingomicrobium marinum]|uniref:hypothetical protein n=1 Tax=Sphingomicrobium marinum TaxID=1227950 RepID=UPI0022405817|nr:hypothetical protein [Sphingomicrobium marinum]